MSRHIDLKIEELLQEEERTKNYSLDLVITDYALKKAEAYAKIICAVSREEGMERMGEDWEGYGYLLKSEWSLDDTVEDICFAEGQDVFSAYVKVSAGGVQATADEMSRLGYTIMGWWHSHGNLPVFHSGTDRNNFVTVTHSVAPSTMYLAERVKPLVEGDYIYFDKTRLHLVKESGSDKTTVEQSEILRKIERNPIAYSLVVNKHGNHYMERREKDLATGKLKEPAQVNLRIVPSRRNFQIGDVEHDVRVKLGFRPAMETKQFYGKRKLVKKFVNHCGSYLANLESKPLENLLARLGKVPLSDLYLDMARDGLVKEGLTKEGLVKDRLAKDGSSKDDLGKDNPLNNTTANIPFEFRPREIRQKLMENLIQSRNGTRNGTNNGTNNVAGNGISYRVRGLFSSEENSHGHYTKDAQDMQADLFMDFMKNFAVDKIEFYQSRAEMYSRCHNQAKNMTRALCQYAQLPLTNYKKNGKIVESKIAESRITEYKTTESKTTESNTTESKITEDKTIESKIVEFNIDTKTDAKRDYLIALVEPRKVNYFLSTLNTTRKVEIKPDFSGQASHIYLYGDRYRIYQQLFTGLVEAELNKGVGENKRTDEGKENGRKEDLFLQSLLSFSNELLSDKSSSEKKPLSEVERS